MISLQSTIVVGLLCIVPISSRPEWSDRAEKTDADFAHGVSSYCPKSQNARWRYPGTNIECCYNEKYKCNLFIDAGETKYNLTNKGLWRRRLCQCDVQLLRCLTNGLSDTDQTRAQERLGEEVCFFSDDNSKPFKFISVFNYMATLQTGLHVKSGKQQ